MNLKSLSYYFSLTKPNITVMVMVTTVIGYYLGGRGAYDSATLTWLLVGVGMTCSGSSALNQYFERTFDAQMERTRKRPLPLGKVTPKQALAFALALIIAGNVILYYSVNTLTTFLSVLSTLLYIGVYTPMKRISWLNTSIGAIPGALPPVGGWTAATGEIGLGAVILFLIMYVWQHPHFYSLAWMYKDDYKQAGFKMLPVVEPDGRSTFRQIMLYSVGLLGLSALPGLLGLSGQIYLFGAVALGAYVLWFSFRAAQSKTHKDARALLLSTVVYLPLWLALVLVDFR